MAHILRELSKIEKQDALILDDFGVQPFDAGSRALLLDIIEDRHGKTYNHHYRTGSCKKMA